MNANIDYLKLFFEEEIFDLDSDEVESYLLDFPENQVHEHLNEKLKILASSWETLIEEPWKLGVTFGSFNKSSADKFILPQIYTAELNLKEAYFEFLTGFWGQLDESQVLLIKKYSNYIVKSLTDFSWSYDLNMKAVEPIVMAFVNNKDVFLADNELNKIIETIKKYSQNNKFDSELKELLK